MSTCSCWVLLSIAFASSAHAESLARITAALPELQAPPQGTTHWAARSMRMNGLPMTLKVFQSQLQPEAVLHHYESSMSLRTSYQVQRRTSSPWHVLTLLSREHAITIQARATNHGSEGTILVSPSLAEASLRLHTTFPRPLTTRIVNLQQYDDGGAEAEHISLSSPRSPAVELRAFSQLLARDGWKVLREGRAHEDERAYVLEAQRNSQHALLTLLPDAAQPATTAIVIAWRKS